MGRGRTSKRLCPDPGCAEGRGLNTFSALAHLSPSHLPHCPRLSRGFRCAPAHTGIGSHSLSGAEAPRAVPFSLMCDLDTAGPLTESQFSCSMGESVVSASRSLRDGAGAVEGGGSLKSGCELQSPLLPTCTERQSFYDSRNLETVIPRSLGCCGGLK